MIRFAMWAQLDAYPGLMPADSANASTADSSAQSSGVFDVAVSQLKNVAPYFIQGMTYGWKFDYTPSDKARNVSEYFEFTPITGLSETEIKSIVYTKPWIENSDLWCWIEYPRSDAMQRYYKSWLTIGHPHIKGTGYGKLTDGFDGIQNAAKEALRNAVREYERKIVKNKPKEIFGRVIIDDPPQIGLDAGRYRVTLDFFMETDRMIEYKKF